MFTFMKVMIMVMALTASNETYDRTIYIDSEYMSELAYNSKENSWN